MVKDKKPVLLIYLIGEAYNRETIYKCPTALVLHFGTAQRIFFVKLV